MVISRPRNVLENVFIYKSFGKEMKTRGRWMFRRVCDVLNKYKAEIMISSSMVDEGDDNCFHGVKPLR